MNANPDFKKLFPNKTDNEIIFRTYNPCEYCESELDCSEDCVVGRLWEIVKSEWEKNN